MLVIEKNDNPKVLGGVVKLVLLRSVCRIFLKINMQPSFIVACQQPTIFRPCGLALYLKGINIDLYMTKAFTDHQVMGIFFVHQLFGVLQSLKPVTIHAIIQPFTAVLILFCVTIQISPFVTVGRNCYNESDIITKSLSWIVVINQSNDSLILVSLRTLRFHDRGHDYWKVHYATSLNTH